MIMRVLYFGTYSKGEGYPRNETIINGLRLNGVEVVECHYPLWQGVEEKSRKPKSSLQYIKLLHRIIKAYIALSLRFFRLKEHDVIIVGYTGHIDIFFARLLNIFRKRPVVFDAFISLYDTVILDRGWFKESSMVARFLWWLDKTACGLANLVLLDTDEHIKYFCREFGLPEEKFLRIFAGAEPNIIHNSKASKAQRDGFTVVYTGTFIPLHGVETIVKGAKILEGEGVNFTLVGKGEMLSEIKSLAHRLKVKNLNFIDRWVPVEELRDILISAQISLGIFGTTKKAQRVIPFKVYNCLALGKAVITADTPAARELLRDGYNAILVPPGKPEALADAILCLKENKDLLQTLSLNAKATYKEHCSAEAIGSLLLSSLEKLVDKPLTRG